MLKVFGLFAFRFFLRSDVGLSFEDALDVPEEL